MTQPIFGISLPAGHQPRLKLYDFRRPDKFSREQIRTLEMLHEELARLLSQWLSVTARLGCEARVSLIDQLTYAEFADALTGNQCLAEIAMDPLPGTMVFHMSAGLGAALADRVCASPDFAADTGPAQQSALDETVLRYLLAGFPAVLRDSWRSITELAPRLDLVHFVARNCQPIPPTEMIVLAELELSIGGLREKLSLVYPFLSLEPVLSRLSARWYYRPTRAEPGAEARRVAAACPVDVAVLARAGSLSVTELRGLKPGATLPLAGLGQGRGILRAGGVQVAELEELSVNEGLCSAALVPAGDPAELGPLDTLEPDSGDAVGRRLLSAMDQLRLDFSRSLDSVAATLCGLKERQDQFDDQLAFGQADLSDRDAEGLRHPFAALNSLDAKTVVACIGQERPQLLALILSFLDDALAGSVIDLLPESRQTDLVTRMLRLEEADPALLAQLTRVLQPMVQSVDLARLMRGGGVQKVAGVLNHVSRATEKQVIQSLESARPELAEEIKRNMFVFEDIIILEEESIRAVFERAETGDILLAMKVVADKERERLFACFPPERRDELRKAYGRIGRVRVRDADAAGMRVVQIIKQLEAEGRIFVAREYEE